MKYLDILKEYDKAIVSESKRLDSIYKKLLGESCNCGKKDCPECNGELKENDKGKMEFDEGEKEGGKQDKKMMPPEDFKQMVSKEEFFGKKDDKGCEGEECNECDPLKGGLHNGHVSEGDEPKKEDKKEEPPTEEPPTEEPPTEEPKKEEPPTEEPKKEEPPAEGAGDKNVEEAQNIEKEIKEFFGVTGDGESGGENLEEDTTENAKMSAADIFAEADEGGEEKKEEPPTEEPPTEEPKKEEPKKDEPPAEEPKKEEPKKEDGEVNENSGKSIRELMGKSEDVSEGEKLSMKEIMAKESCCNECDPLKGGLHNGHQVQEEVDDETKNLNESIQAIRQFVKANKKYFK